MGVRNALRMAGYSPVCTWEHENSRELYLGTFETKSWTLTSSLVWLVRSWMTRDWKTKLLASDKWMELKVLTCAESSLSSMLSQLSVICIICILFSLFCPILAFQLPQSIIIQLMLGMWLQPSTLHTYHHSQHQQRESLCSSHIQWGGKNHSHLSVVCQRRSKLARWASGYSQCQCWWKEERERIEGEGETESGCLDPQQLPFLPARAIDLACKDSPSKHQPAWHLSSALNYWTAFHIQVYWPGWSQSFFWRFDLGEKYWCWGEANGLT